MKIIFNSNNSTSKAALIINDKFGFLAQHEAEKIFNEMDVEGGAFGSIQLVPASTHYKSAKYDLAELKPIDIKQYIVEQTRYVNARNAAIDEFADQFTDDFEKLMASFSPEFDSQREAFVAQRLESQGIIKP
ncbi:hypothetical protein [Pseudoalteromonas peptidolytica]|uniref:Uncharacterized protein n=1 Tax=Pseudoalteromonas peptidolytica F12-50-A1 TaxID=1315280 RepID=A0A8I0T6H5_9GAMM|nr:hypothetical protein [Pseudoalteromonas peptidolytica]MBE0348303.1 hypothetical protein [Pseudoalteromonas peptidolytica F12-50-A1]NLR16585.1 hypothetical protein [Pseudoalteromonas peptidolytica]GEK08955.1 hypothetical protein PPE03_12040 [Pseudoalteromonas peptidolytica]